MFGWSRSASLEVFWVWQVKVGKKDQVKTAARQADDDAIEAMFRPRAGVIFNFEEGQREAEIRVGEARFELMLGGLVERRCTSDNQGPGRLVGEPSVDEGRGAQRRPDRPPSEC